MLGRQPLVDALTPRPGASPGLMRRRYSVPETIMRKYRLAQLRSDSEESLPVTAPSRAASPASPGQGSCASLCEPPTHRFMRRDRELMRKSALMRRLWGGGRQTASNNELAPCPSCSCEAYSDRDLYDSHAEYGRESRSLDGSRAELRNVSGGFSRSSRTKESHTPVAGWATPKRQRLESPNGINSSDEMLRTAMRNSYERAEEQREREKREEPPSSDSTFQSHGREPSSGEVSRYTETPESVDTNKPRKKRRQSVCIYINNLESPSVEIKSETVTDTPETIDSYTMPNSSELTTTSNSTFVTSEIPSTNVLCETSTGCYDTASTGDAKYSDSLEVTESSIDRSEEEPTCIAKIDKPPIIKGNMKSRSQTNLSDSTIEILEIVVSETLTSSVVEDNKDIPVIENARISTRKNLIKDLDIPNINTVPVKKQHVDLDQYVSNILVESLNSLTDQIEVMTASMGSDRKISIVEKEIKVKLQNTGMNTIVHLSPTSNNPIIFGNAELYDKDEDEVHNEECFEDKSTSDRGTIKIEITDNNDMRPTDSSENVTHISSKELENDSELSLRAISNENINKTVLQQIQKLFHDGLEFDPKLHYPGKMVPEISHIEISNVDVYIDEHSDPNCVNDRIELNTERNSRHFDCSLEKVPKSTNDSVLGEVGTGTYFKEPAGPVLVPRFSAFPNTDSMEVNTSSDEAEVVGSDCTSLVDSLDDPNSPRNIMLREAYSNRRSELVRSAIDVLDLLPEMSQSEAKSRGGEKSEAFFIRIRDNDCDCEKENVVVADHMPDKIKQRLYRRHRKRELRMEFAKRKKVRLLKREIDKQRSSESVKSKKEIEKDCTVILQSLIDEIVTKIAEEEHKYTKIKQNSKHIIKKPIEHLTLNKKLKNNRKSDDLSKLESFKVNKNGDMHFCSSGHEKNKRSINDKTNGYDYKKSEKSEIPGNPSLKSHAPASPEEYIPKRIYQKSEIHDGNKCIEILEILEYVDSSQSSPDATNSDESQNNKLKHRKSKIPIPIYERIHRIPKAKTIPKSYKNDLMARSSPNLKFEKITNYSMDNLIADILIDAINDNEDESSSEEALKSEAARIRRASVPQQEVHRSRSNSLRFKQIFDIIPEEKSSLSVESSNEDINLNRRVSAPNLASKYEANNNGNCKTEDSMKLAGCSTSSSKISKSTSTSPSLEYHKIAKKNAITSPIRKTTTAATSPIVLSDGVNADKTKSVNSKQTNNAKKSLSSQGTKEGWVGFYRPNKQLIDEEGIKEAKSKNKTCLKSAYTQYDVTPSHSTVRTIESENTTKQIIIKHDKSRTTGEKSQTVGVRNRVEETNVAVFNANEPKRRTEKDLFDRIKSKEAKSKRQSRMMHSHSDPQTRNEFVVQNKDTKIQMISAGKSEEDEINSKSLKFPSFKDKFDNKAGETTSDSDSDSNKSLLCSLAPKWLSMGSGVRQKRQTRKKSTQDQSGHQNPGSTILAAKNLKKQNDSLPEVDSYRNSRSKHKGTAKTVVPESSPILPALLAPTKRDRRTPSSGGE